jgi:hypothetical protein
MGIVFNPFTQNLDFTGSGGGGPAPRYTASFTSSGSWTTSGSDYTYSVPVSTHAQGVNPNVQVYQLISGSYELVNVNTNVDTSGNIMLTVSGTPDNRFDGLILIL